MTKKPLYIFFFLACLHVSVSATTAPHVKYYNGKPITEHFISHPDKFESWLKFHKSEIPALNKYIDYRIKHAKNEREYDAYSHLKFEINTRTP